MDAADEDPFLDRSYRRTVGRLQIPGFRKGKAPRSIVESYVGRTALVQEALDFMIPETLDQALKDDDVQALAEPQVAGAGASPISSITGVNVSGRICVVPLAPMPSSAIEARDGGRYTRHSETRAHRPAFGVLATHL